MITKSNVPAVLVGEVLTCPTCTSELTVYEECRTVDRITYSAPRFDPQRKEWTYTSDRHPRNENVELLDRYLQCHCGYTAAVEDRHDEYLPAADDAWTCPGCTATVEPADVAGHITECTEANSPARNPHAN